MVLLASITSGACVLTTMPSLTSVTQEAGRFLAPSIETTHSRQAPGFVNSLS